MTVGAGERGGLRGGGQKGQHGRAARHRWSSRAGYPCGRAWAGAGYPHERRESNFSLGGFHG